jgi:tRNA-dihydrouridine synthase 2
MFTCHPIEKPYLIFQVGSADPDLAVQAARLVVDDVSGVELNCGCPKPFSTHSGMGAALLTNPDLLCSILSALRRELPPRISVSAKIRLLLTQQDTFALVERIVNTGINCLTIHCRTRNMRPRERALVHRLKEIVDFVKGLGRDVAVIENGDCVGLEDARRIRAVTGAGRHDRHGCRGEPDRFLAPPAYRLGGHLHLALPPPRTFRSLPLPSRPHSPTRVLVQISG